MPKERRTFALEFKQQMVDLYEKGKSRLAIIEEYELNLLLQLYTDDLDKHKLQALSKKKIIVR